MKPAEAPPVEALAGEVERILCDLDAQFQRLGALAKERLEAMRSADTARLARCIASENDAVQAVAEIERRRIVAVGRLAARFESQAGAQTRVSWLAERVGGSIGERIGRRADELKQGIAGLRKANEVARLAALNLSAHMEGLWRQAAQALNHSKTYGRQGLVAPGAAVVSAIDMKT